MEPNLLASLRRLILKVQLMAVTTICKVALTKLCTFHCAHPQPCCQNIEKQYFMQIPKETVHFTKIVKIGISITLKINSLHLLKSLKNTESAHFLGTPCMNKQLSFSVTIEVKLIEYQQIAALIYTRSAKEQNEKAEKGGHYPQKDAQNAAKCKANF